MKLYSCARCRNLLYFENTVCLHCGSVVGFDAGRLSMVTLSPTNTENEYADITNSNDDWRFCDNAAHAACNWVIPATQATGFCIACDLNRTIPSLHKKENLDNWRKIEIAKHRLVYSLLRLQLPVESKKEEDEETGIAFDFMVDTDQEKKVMTGHDKGIVTLNIEEADEKERVKHKLDLGEKYRTLLGHFRHEIGHYYWDVFFKDNVAVQDFRNFFGDETTDYTAALEKYYANGAPPNWNDYFISPYASAHPWEDWAESWSHYLHLIDTLETAYSFGIDVNPVKAADQHEMQASISRDPYNISNFDEIIKLWLPLTFAVNSLNRSMGYQDFYPFIISGTVIEKLRFIHNRVKGYSS